MSYEEFLDEVKILQYACPFGLIFNTKNYNEEIIPSIHKEYNGIMGFVSYDKCLEFYKKWVKEINESEIKEHGYHFTHEHLLNDAKTRFKLEKENPEKLIYKSGNNWKIFDETNGYKIF